MVIDIVMQRAQFVMVIERVIQFVRHDHRADPQQHGGQQPGNKSRFSFCGAEHEG